MRRMMRAALVAVVDRLANRQAKAREEAEWERRTDPISYTVPHALFTAPIHVGRIPVWTVARRPSVRERVAGLGNTVPAPDALRLHLAQHYAAQGLAPPWKT